MSAVYSGLRIVVRLDGAFNDYHPLMYDPTESMKQQIYYVIGYYYSEGAFTDIDIVVEDTTQMEDDDDDPIEVMSYTADVEFNPEELAEEVINALEEEGVIFEEDPVPQYYDESICKMMREGA